MSLAIHPTLRPNSLFSLSFRVLYLLIWTPWGSWQESCVSSEDLRWSGHPVTKVQLTFVQHLKPKFVFFSNKEWVLYLWIWTPGCSWLDSWVSWEHPWWSGHNTNLCFHFFSFLIMGRARAGTRQTRRGVQHECSFSCCVAAVCIFFLRSVCSSWPTITTLMVLGGGLTTTQEPSKVSLFWNKPSFSTDTKRE